MSGPGATVIKTICLEGLVLEPEGDHEGFFVRIGLFMAWFPSGDVYDFEAYQLEYNQWEKRKIVIV
jgi:hypothetical protein